MESDFIYLYHAFLSGGQGAATAMKCHPSNITRAVQRAETELGYPLFIRHVGGRLEPLPIMEEFFLKVVTPAVEGMAAFKALGRSAHHGAILRLGATELLVREYLAPIVAQLQRSYPTLRIELHLGNRDFVEQWLEAKAIDLVILAAEEPPRKWLWREFIQVSPVLVTLEGAPFAGLDAVLAREDHPHRLVCPPAGEGVCRRFERLLQERGKRWPVTIVAGSTALVPWMLSAPDMVGLSVAVQALERAGVVRHPLPVPPLHVGAMWRGRPTPLLAGLLDLIAHTAPRFQLMARQQSAGVLPAKPVPAAHPPRGGKPGAPPAGASARTRRPRR